MNSLFNTFDAISYALRMLDSSFSFIFDLVEYLPAIIGSAVIVFVAVYVIRFFLAK